MANIIPDSYTPSWTDDWGKVTIDGMDYALSGTHVQHLIKEQISSIKEDLNVNIGYLYGVEDTTNNQVVLLGFSSKETYLGWSNKYSQDPLSGIDDADVLSKVNITKAIPQPFYSSQLINGYSSNKYISIDGNIVIPVKYSYTYNEYDLSNSSIVSNYLTDEGKLTIQAKKYTVSSWDDSYEMILSIDSIKTENDPFINVDLTSFIDTDGKWDVRMKVDTGDNLYSSSWIVYTVIKTKIDVSLTTDWTIPQTNNYIALRFNYEGNHVDKYLNVVVTGAGGNSPGAKKEFLDKAIGNGSGQTDLYKITQSASDSYQINAHGVHNIEYWVEVDKDSNYSTPHKYAQIMVVSDKSNTTPYIIFNNVIGDTQNNPLINWTQNDMFDFAVCAPDGNGGYLNNFDVNIEFKNSQGSPLFGQTFETNYGSYETYSAGLSLGDNVDTLWMYCTSNNGENLLGDAGFKLFYVDNNGDYAPTPGAKFVLNPKTRFNNDPDRNKIYNSATSDLEEISNPVWENVSFNDYDGWISDANGEKCLRILDGERLTIPYYPFTQDNDSERSFTFEMTLSTKNLINNNIPLLTVKSENRDGKISGFELCGERAYFLLNQERDAVDGDGVSILNDQDIVFSEDEKMHIAVCVNDKEYMSGQIIKADIPSAPGGAPHQVSLQNNVNFVRIYINGVLSRVISYENGGFDYDDKKSIIIGNTSDQPAGDIDIYEIRIYKEDRAKRDYEILKDYCSSLATTDQKNALIDRNRIINVVDDKVFQSGTISMDEAIKLGYNVLLWKPSEDLQGDETYSFVRPNGREFGDTDKKSSKYRVGDLEVIYFKKGPDGLPVKDEKRSGVLHNMTSEGQGTTAMTYFKWNQRFKFDGVGDEDSPEFIESYFTPVSGESYGGYDLNDEDPIIGRLDGKVNWASSMQSHKMGSVSLYHDLWKNVVGGNALTRLSKVEDFDKLDLKKMGSKYSTSQEAFEDACKFTGRANSGYSSCRVAVRQEPFLYFVKPDRDTDPIFYSMMTWGASKGDKPTFGYNKKFNPLFTMIEGSDNTRSLIECKVPWDDTHVEQIAWKDGEVDGPITYWEGDQGIDQFEFSMGNGKEEAVGRHWEKNPCLVMFKDMINFVYLHNPNIEMYNGTYDDMKNDATLDISKFYWVNVASNNQPEMSSYDKSERFDLYRFNKARNEYSGWVPAGMYDENTGTYNRLNLRDQLDLNTSGILVENLNNRFINERAARFVSGYNNYIDHAYGYDIKYPNGINDFMHLNDLQYTVQFLKLIAGTDNWAKNTYIYNTGVYYKKGPDGKYLGGSEKYEGLDKFGFFQDDLDTIFEIDNFGAKTKPYYVEEGDYVIGDNGKDYYWNSHDNALYMLAGLSKPEDMKTVMRNILSAMGDPAKCFEEYYQKKTQSCFPEYVFNKASELTYIDGHLRGSSFGGRYSYYLTQCLGNQELAEKDWQVKRSNYMSSYARYGDFAGGTSGKGLGLGVTGEVNLTPTPYIWLYPLLTEGSNDNGYLGKFPESCNVEGRVPANQQFSISVKSQVGSENEISLKGYKFYKDLGNLARVKPQGGEFRIDGKYLSKLEIKGTTENGGIVFNPTRLSIPDDAEINNLRSIEISGKTANNAKIFNIDRVNLERLWRLSKLDLSATNISNIVLPKNTNLEILKLPATIKSLDIQGLSKLTTFELPKYSNLETVIVKDTDTEVLNSFNVFINCYNSKAPLNSFTANNINWENITLDQLNYILSIPNCNIVGYITVNEEIDFDIKMRLLNKFGNIDNPNNDLHITYGKTETSNINKIKIQGKSSITSEGSYQYSLKGIGTDFTEITWSTSNETFGKIDAKTGVFTFEDNVGIEDLLERIVEIYCSVVLSDGRSTTTGPFEVKLYEQPAKIGDYVYYDGTYASPDEDMGDKTKIAVCFYAGAHKYEGVKIKQNRLAMSLDVISDVAWGLGEKKYNWSADTPVDNFTSNRAPNQYTGLNSWYINQNMAKDVMTNPKNYDTYASGDFGWDSDENPKGKVNTSLLMGYRDQILRDENFDEDYDNPTSGWTGSTDPNEYAYLIKLLNSAPDNLVYYPAASYCYAYEPGIITNGKVQLKENEILSNKFKAHNWFLPAAGELIYMWYGVQFKQDYSNDKTLKSFDEYSNENKHYIWSSSETDKPVAAWSIMVQNGATSFNFAGSTDATSTSNNRGGGKTISKDRKVIPVVEF